MTGIAVSCVDLTDRLLTKWALEVEWDLERNVIIIYTSCLNKPTARQGVLSTISAICDPLGLLAPFIVQGKIIFQDEIRYR